MSAKLHCTLVLIKKYMYLGSEANFIPMLNNVSRADPFIALVL